MQNRMKLVTPIKVVRCQECGEPLTDPESIAQGIGPVCASKRESAFAVLANVQEAVAQGYSDYWINEHLDRYESLLRIKQQKEAASGYVSPRLIDDLRKTRDRVVRRAEALNLHAMTVAQIVASANINFWIVEEAA